MVYGYYEQSWVPGKKTTLLKTLPIALIFLDLPPKMGDIDLDVLNQSEDYSRKYEKVQDNKTSQIQVSGTIIVTCIQTLMYSQFT